MQVRALGSAEWQAAIRRQKDPPKNPGSTAIRGSLPQAAARRKLPE